MSNEKIKPGPTPFEKELSVEVRITALNGANVRGIKVYPEDMDGDGGEAFIFEEIKKAIRVGLRMDKRLRRDYVKRLGIDKDLGETETEKLERESNESFKVGYRRGAQAERRKKTGQ
jgi:hypothetical protein